MSLHHFKQGSLVIFCKVVDNFGDIGICWRLARQLQQEYGLAVTLWVDDLKSFQRICPAVRIHQEVQTVEYITVRFWRDQEGIFSAGEVADIVIEFFACDIPPRYIAAMAACNPRPVWLNLEGLTAEEWVEGCHTLPSPHPRLPLTKYFFFPGFTNKTGGLLHEFSLEEKRQQFQSNALAKADFFAQLGATSTEIASFKVSLFCYPHAPVENLFDVWKTSENPITCFVPEGVAATSVETFFGGKAIAGEVKTQGALTVRILPFIPQPDYDKLLWACDFNIVRGEDSFVRAQWAGVPFVWHIYPQDENLHFKKLRAFLTKYADENDALINFFLWWNDANGAMGEEQVSCSLLWRSMSESMSKISDRATEWRKHMLENGDLAAKLIQFANAVRSAAAENKV